MAKRIVIHIGLPKTGSSALQARLSRNAVALARLGISYPNPESDRIANHTGNLLHVILSRAAADGVIASKDELMQAYLAQAVDAALDASPCQTVLLSGEFISGSMTDGFVPWLRSLEGRHSVTIIAFVRDIYDLTVSSWKQKIKTSVASADLGDFLKTIELEKGNTSVHHLAMLAGEGFDLRVISYDHHKTSVLDALLAEMGVDTVGVDLDRGEDRIFNRSLSYRQAKMVALASQAAGSSTLSAMLLKRFRTSIDLRKDPVFGDIDLALLDIYRPELAVLNEFLPEGQKLRVVPRPSAVDPDAGLFDAADISLLLEACGNLLAEAAASPPVAPETAPPGLPADFNAAEYLLRNPDVNDAGMDPIYHYLNHGRFEHRSYKGQELTPGTAKASTGAIACLPASTGIHFDFLESREFGHRDHFFHFMLGYLLPALDIALAADAPPRVSFEDCGPLMNAVLAQACRLLGLELADDATSIGNVLVPRWDRYLFRPDGSRPPEALGEAFRSAIRRIRHLMIERALGSCADAGSEAPWGDADVLVFRRSPEHPFYAQGGGARHPGYGAGTRDMCNAAEVTRALIHAGINAREIDLGTLPFAEQIAAIHRAKAVVGARGAEFAHLVWMKPSSAALMFATPMASPNHAARTLADILDVRLLEIEVAADRFDAPVERTVAWGLELGLRRGSPPGDRT